MDAMNFAELRRLIVESAGDNAELHDDAALDRLFADLGYDSLALIETAARIRDEYGVAVSDERLVSLQTPRELLDEVNTMIGVRSTRHSARIAAPAQTVYNLLADASMAPLLFPAPVYYDRRDGGTDWELVHIWVRVGGRVEDWESVRRFDPVDRVVTFSQRRKHPLVRSMSGEFRLAERGDVTEVSLSHRFVPADDDPQTVATIERAIEANSTSQLAGLSAAAELPLEDLLITVQESLEARGSAADAYEFVRRADTWQDQVPHIATSSLREEDGVQYLEKSVIGPDGARHDSTSVRLCLPPDRIVFKQTTPPAPLRANIGEWTFRPTEAGSVLGVRHVVLLRPGTDRDAIRAAIADTARETLRRARDHAEGRR